MRTSTIILLALATTATLAITPEADAEPRVKMPSAPLTVRSQCFGYARDEAIPSTTMRSQATGGRRVTRAKKAEAPRAAAAAPMATPMAGASLDMAPAEESEAPAFSDAPEDDGVADIGAFETKEAAPRSNGPRVDWGGETWLSNDDSMSLASAQRLLFALDQGVGFNVSQIRPHELLNYFTFDSVQPRGSDTFAVQASAEVVQGDTLSLALAVQGATPKRDPLDLTLVVDRSGSMSAEGRMEYTHRALRHLADNMTPGDRVDVVLFDSTICTPIENFVVGRDDPAVLYSTISQIQPRGSTDLDSGLKEAYRVAGNHTADAGRSQRIMLFTDAMLNTGDVNPHTVSDIGKALDEHDIRLTGVGVGRNFRDDVLNKLTEKGKGAYVFLGSERVVDRLFDTGFEALISTIAHDVRFKLDLPPSLGMQKFYGEESSTNKEDIQPVHFHAGNSQVFLQDLAIRDGNLVRTDAIDLEISWDDPSTGQRRTQNFTTTVGNALSADPHNARKGRALMAWTDILTNHAMGGDACGESFTDYRRAIDGLQGDAEVAYVSELVGRWCDFSTPVAAWTEPAFLKVRLDSDIAISGLELDCGRTTASASLSASDTVARLEAAPGTCALTLHGAVPMTTRVEVPQNGADMRCVIRGGRLNCS